MEDGGGRRRRRRRFLCCMFLKPESHLQKVLRPYRGLIVAFEAGNLHGVMPVLDGQRCAVTAWYTLNPSFQESRASVKNILNTYKQQKGHPVYRHTEL